MHTVGRLSNNCYLLEVDAKEYDLIYLALEKGEQVSLDIITGSIGERIKTYRFQHGLTQQKFSKLAGNISVSYICKLERGHRISMNTSKYKAIERALRGMPR